MAELDEIRQSLLLAKEALRAPAAARVRLRTQLVATGAWPAATGAPGDTASNAAALRVPADTTALQLSARGSALHGAALRFSSLVQHPVAAWAAALLLGLGFGAGYWVGHNDRALAGTVSTPGAAALATPERTAALSPAASPSTSGNGANAAERTGLDDTALRDTALDDAALENSAPSEARLNDSTLHATAIGKSSTLDSASASRSATTSTGAATKALPRSPRRSLGASGAPRAFAAELALVQRAERAIRAGDAELALALLADLDRAFPTPALREERRAARLLAECERGATLDSGASSSTAGPSAASPKAASESRSRALQFLTEQPGSVYSDRIRRICAIEDGAALSKPSSEGSADPGH